MKLDELYLFNFRAFRSIELKLSKKTLFFGPNGAGKTTLLEAIYMLCWGRSFRTSRDIETIKWGESSSHIEGKFKEEEFYSVKLSLTYKGKKIVLNGKHISRAELIGKIPVLFLSPEELSMIDGPPKLRRAFIDRVLSQVDDGYLIKYRSYFRLLKEKNSILSKSKSYTKLLEIIDERMLSLAIYIWERRRKFLDLLKDEEIQIKFKPSGLDIELEHDLLKEIMHSRRKDEIRRGFSLFGPHLDEFEIMKNGVSLRRYGSRGEKKWVAWKIYLKTLDAFIKTGTTPIFLIDEILAELDPLRRQNVWKELSKLSCQVFMTTLSPQEGEGFIALEVKNGEIRKYNS